jgi:hypothetical protein
MAGFQRSSVWTMRTTPAKTEVRSGLYGLRELFPWPGNKPEGSPEIHGWLEDLTKIALEPALQGAKVVLELGSYHGISTRWFCDTVMNVEVIAVDHWLGSSHMWNEPGIAEDLPFLYETFIAASWEYRERIYPVRAHTLAGMRLVHRQGIAPDVIYIDASHETEDVILDLETARNLFPGARIVGDDWDWPSVQAAVTDVATRLGIEFRHNDRAWWIPW